MFERPKETYAITANTVKGVLTDLAGPLYQTVNYIPSGSKVLDIGAGNGLLAMLFKEAGKEVFIDGIEPSKAAAKIAKKHYSKFSEGYIQDYLPEIKSGKYDYLVLADVIEHVFDPYVLLLDLIRAAGSNTKIIISTPNIAFGSVRLALLGGKFEYVNSGLLEKTHVRFFTKQLLEEMIKNLGIGVEKAIFLERRIDQTEIPTSIKGNRMVLWRMLNDDTASTYQFFLVLSKKSKTMSLNRFDRVGNRVSLYNLIRGR
jgi:2-polyprenyl-3-methyl-5-hydroxy-6-metoxy-1,4-benzoquinol methylase